MYIRQQQFKQMNKVLITVLLSANTLIGFAQKGKTASATSTVEASGPSCNMTDLFAAQMAAYKNAMRYYDLQAATVALYAAQALKPERADLTDSLAYLYFAGERYGQSYLVGEEILKKDSKRDDIREIVAVSKQSLGMNKEALADYETLYKNTKDLQFLYQIGTLQYQLKRYGECIGSLDLIIADPASAQQQVALRNQDGSGQKVPMKAAAYNVKGICAMEVNQTEAAKENFSKALELFPEFLLAKNNMNFLSQSKEQKATSSQPQAQPKK